MRAISSRGPPANQRQYQDATRDESIRMPSEEGAIVGRQRSRVAGPPFLSVSIPRYVGHEIIIFQGNYVQIDLVVVYYCTTHVVTVDHSKEPISLQIN